MVLDLMKETSSKPGSDVRIVVVSSLAHAYADGHPIKFEDEAEISVPFPATNYNGWSNMMARYGRSKLATILFVTELQRRLNAEGSNIITLSLDPGAVATNGAHTVVSRIPVIGGFHNLIIGSFFITPDNGALTSLFAATSPAVRANPEKFKGKYLTPYDKITTPSKLAQDEELAKRLWDLSEKILASRIVS
ncbi:oxidoreductase family protein [Ceratobasidium sp. AG-Ba]|nr:oxidoreductase family protein [Ceratobasidium sp. AG-Ba]